MSDSNPLQPGRRVGADRFTLAKPLGRGGMGEVWLAQDERLHEPVALKFLPPEVRGDPNSLDDLRRETARSHRLTHQNIVRIHDLHEDPGSSAFISMEFVDGPTLAALRVEQPARVLPWDFLKPLVQQLCAALDYAHEEKVIHRDLKPANMMLDGKSRLKLADFGIAATVSDATSRISLRHATSGTLAYMSPQQLAGKRPSVADDIYALGATLYELLTSKPPFYTGDLTHQVLNEPAEPLDERLVALEIQNEIPPDVSALIMACLAKDPAQRPQSAAAVAGWIGMDLAAKPSTERLAAQLGSENWQDESSSADAVVASVHGILNRRWLWPAFGAFAGLLLAIGGWLWRTHDGRGDAPASQSQMAGTEPAVSATSSRTSLGMENQSGAIKPLRDVETWEQWQARIGATNAPANNGFEDAVRAFHRQPPLSHSQSWLPLFDGKTLSGWTAPDPSDWRVDADGSMVVSGSRSHLFSPKTYANLEVKAEIKLGPDANGALAVRAARGAGAPACYMAQANIDSAHPLAGSVFKLTRPGGRFKQETPVRVPEKLVTANTWFTQHIVAVGNRIVVKINDRIVADYVDKDSPMLSGHVVLKQWHPGAAVTYRNVMVKPLPDDSVAAWAEARKDVPDLKP